jgi:hypothetical protein
MKSATGNPPESERQAGATAATAFVNVVAVDEESVVSPAPGSGRTPPLRPQQCRLIIHSGPRLARTLPETGVGETTSRTLLGFNKRAELLTRRTRSEQRELVFGFNNREPPWDQYR